MRSTLPPKFEVRLGTCNERAKHFPKRRVFLSPGGVEQLDQPFIRKTVDFSRADESSVASGVADVLCQPLESFIPGRIIGENIGRRLNLDGAGFLSLRQIATRSVECVAGSRTKRSSHARFCFTDIFCIPILNG